MLSKVARERLVEDKKKVVSVAEVFKQQRELQENPMPSKPSPVKAAQAEKSEVK